MSSTNESKSLEEKLLDLISNAQSKQKLKRKYKNNKVGGFRWPKQPSSVWSFESIRLIVIAYLILTVAIALTIFTGGVYVEIGGYIAQGQGALDIHNLGAKTVSGWFLIGWPLSWLLWFVSWCLNQFEVTFWGLLGFFLFLGLQFTEVRPLLLRFSPQAMRAKIHQIETHQQIQIKDSDSLELALYKNEYNNYYVEDLAKAKRNRNIAFVIDIGIMLLFMPLINCHAGDIRIIELHQHLDALSSDFDIPNIIRLIMSAFGINWIVARALDVKKNAFLFKSQTVETPSENTSEPTETTEEEAQANAS